jgi:hypothetical protein
MTKETMITALLVNILLSMTTFKVATFSDFSNSSNWSSGCENVGLLSEIPKIDVSCVCAFRACHLRLVTLILSET